MYGACTLQAGNGYGSRLLCATVQRLARILQQGAYGAKIQRKTLNFEVEIDSSNNINTALFRNFQCAEPGYEDWRCIPIKNAAEDFIQFRFVDGEEVDEYRKVLAQGLKGSNGLGQGQKRSGSSETNKQAAEKTKRIKTAAIDAISVFNGMRKGDVVDVLEELCADKNFRAAFASVQEHLCGGCD